MAVFALAFVCFAALLAEVASGVLVLVVFVSDFGSPFFACLPVGSWLSFRVDNLFLMIFSYSSPACCGPGQFVPHPFVQPVLFLGLETLALMCLVPSLLVVSHLFSLRVSCFCMLLGGLEFQKLIAPIRVGPTCLYLPYGVFVTHQMN